MTENTIKSTSSLRNGIFKSGYVAIIGRPNVGKSTLINGLLNFKLSIISPKPQTTRHRILGILTGTDYQVIFFDTPGLVEPKYRLHASMVKNAQRAIKDADVITVLVEAGQEHNQDNVNILQDLEKHGKPIILCINKIDLVPRLTLLPAIDWLAQNFKLHEIIPMSALLQDGMTELKNALTRWLPEGVPLYPEDQITEHPERFFVSEIIREKIFMEFEEEIPYSTAVVIDDFKEKPGAKDLMRARIVVERNSQKGIIIGKKGQSIKKIGQRARKDIEIFLGRPVYLELQVVVREKWRKKEVFIKEFGYE